MNRRQLALLFVCSLIPYIAGNTQLTLLPIYLKNLGTDPASSGNYLALLFLALAIGTLSAGWLSDHLQRRKPVLIVTALLIIPLTFMLSQITQVWQLVSVLAITWFLYGVGLGTVNILAGMFAGENERGRVFGIIGLSIGLGTMIGGTASGIIVNHGGYPVLFVVVAALDLVTPLTGCLLQDKPPAHNRSRSRSTGQASVVLGMSFFMLLIASTVVNASSFVAGLGRPLFMDKSGFDSAAISSVIVVAGAVGIPVPLMVGWLSDRLGRYRLLILCYLAAVASVALVAVSVSLWHFWIAAALGAGIASGNAVAAAFVTDLVPPEALGTSLSWLGTTGWVGGVIGFVVTGYMIQGLGLTTALLVGGSLPLLALLLVRRRSFQRAALTERTSPIA